MEKATSRLRRTFAYPTDDDDDDPNSPTTLPETLDEQEQDALIASLTQQNESRNAQFRLLLLVLPIASTVPYLLALVSPPTPSSSSHTQTQTTRSTALLSLTSLACTAWTLWAQAPGRTGIRALDAWTGSGISAAAGGKGVGSNYRRKKRDDDDYDGNGRGDITSIPFWAEEHHDSPLARYLPYLNLGLCAVLVLTGLLTKSGASQGHWGHVGLNNLPAVVYGVVLIAKMVMGSVDPERELSALRYEYKGA
ncbi:hypothetical protein F5B19DRAFT_450346 [Rostrohypoxylon terebratum]|nr:hypothetical protein F5B19DRAFT_450346 [Rostrohypoxylon terebratum]